MMDLSLSTSLTSAIIGAGGPADVLVPWGLWSYLNGGTGATQDPTPATATLASSVASPPGTGQGTSGATCTGITRDATRNRYILGNHGQPIEGSVAPELTSLITLDAALAKTGEVAIDYGAPYSGIKGIQGISPDTVNNRIGICVPSIPAISFFDPTTLLFIGRLMLTGVVSQPNGYAFDPSRNAHWVTDNADNKIRLISQTGQVLLTYTPTAFQVIGLDQLDYDAVNDRLLFSTGGGSDASRGYVFALDIPKMRVVAAGRAAEAAAPEGICLTLDGTQLVFASDGEYHSITPYPIAAPNNVNRLLLYPASILAAYHYARRELIGANNRIIADILAGTTNNDFSLFTNTVTVTATSKLFRFRAYSNDGQTYPIFWRLGANIFQGSVGPAPVNCDMPAQTVAGSAAFQIGLRKGGAPYNTGAFCDITIEPLYLTP